MRLLAVVQQVEQTLRRKLPSVDLQKLRRIAQKHDYFFFCNFPNLTLSVGYKLHNFQAARNKLHPAPLAVRVLRAERRARTSSLRRSGTPH